ncbi:MAG: ABC transporter ATP-binding protein [Bifidobacteriaceae bacterium]|nr:ABC transporter ATP-binding protein [Bifidobacteriaceae bacterium]
MSTQHPESDSAQGPRADSPTRLHTPVTPAPAAPPRAGGPRPAGAVIAVEHLTKDYGHGRGVFDASFEVGRGEVFGFVGPNGAGKTTAIRHLMGFSAPQSGRTSILGFDCWAQPSQIHSSVGYLPGEIALPEGLTGSQFIRFMQGLGGRADGARLAQLLDLFQLEPRGTTKRMSLGDKRKLAVVTAFMGDPEVLVLDEPSSGLDPIMQERFIEFLRQEKGRGKTILLSSHMFSEVQAVCDRVAVIKDGRIVSTVRVDDIRHSETKTYRIKFAALPDFGAFLTGGGIQVVFADQAEMTVEARVRDGDVKALIQSLAALRVADFQECKVTLEDHFFHLYARQPQEGRPWNTPSR